MISNRQRRLHADPQQANIPPAYSYSTRSASSQLAEKLPEYSSGTEINSCNPHVTPTVAVLLDQPSKRFDVDDIVTGRIVFSPRYDCVLGSVSATLGGEERTAKTHWVSQSTLQKKMRLAQHSVSPSAFPQGSIARKGFTYSFTFSIQVPLTHGGSGLCNCGSCGSNFKDSEPCLIPPTMGPTPEMGQVYEPASIYYFVNASIVTLVVPQPDDSTAAGVTTDSVYTCESPPFLTIVPSYPNFPKVPTYAEAEVQRANTMHGNGNKTPSPKQNVNEVSIEIKRGLLKNTQVGIAELSLAQEPLIISADASDVSYAKCNLRFTPFCVSNLCEQPPKITHILSRLTALTTYALPSDEDTESVTENSYSEPIPLCQLATNKPVWKSHGSAEYTSSINIPLTLLPFHSNSLPSFKSKYITRNYELKLTVGLGSANLTLSIPACITASFVAKHYYNDSPILTMAMESERTSAQRGLLSRSRADNNDDARQTYGLSRTSQTLASATIALPIALPTVSEHISATRSSQSLAKVH